MIGATAKAMLAALERGSTTSEALVGEHLQQIKEKDGAIGAFLYVDEDGALEAARRVDRQRKEGIPVGPLAGLPVALKDNINVKGLPLTCGSRILENFNSPYDAGVVERLRAADAVIVGKTNMDEFAMGSSTEYSALKETKNPIDPERVPGGSSGGSAAAVAAQMVPLALGSSTGGSIRQPASFCGLVGMKPTYGCVSRYGLVAYGSSLDQIGPFARDVDGATRLLKVIAGHDARDATSAAQASLPMDAQDSERPRKPTLGLVREFASEGVQPQVRHLLERAVSLWLEDGAGVETCSFPHTEFAIPAYYLVATAEASANLARFDGVRYGHRAGQIRNLKDMYIRSRSEGFGDEVKRRILLGTYCLSSGYYQGFYQNAQKVRTKIIGDFEKAFETVDFILAPTSPTTAFKRGEKLNDPVAMYLSDIFTVTANLAGIPAITIPCGTDDQGLPIGLQLMGKRFQDASLLGFARELECLMAKASESQGTTGSA